MNLGAETVTHINLVAWFKHNYPDYADDIYHFANERRCSIQQGKILKRMSVVAGVSDLFFSIPMGKYHGLWVEIKEGKGKLSQHQKDFLARMTVRGYMAVCVWGLDDAKEVIKSYLNMGDT